MATTTVYDGSASFTSGSSTPFGLYDGDTTFAEDAPKVADWCARRIGYPIVDIELQDQNLFACFEESVTEYSSQVNRFNIKENLLSVRGLDTGSEQNRTHKHFDSNLEDLVGISQAYGTEAGVGGNATLYSGSVSISNGSQTYDLTDSNVVTYESGTPGTDTIEVRRVFYEASPAMTRFFDPHIGSGLGSQQMLTQFGWGNYSPAINYLLMPMYDDLLRVQAIEFNDQIRKSAYSFHIQNNRLRIFPIPTEDYTIHFHYLKTGDKFSSVANKVSDFSNATYNNMLYRNINDPGKQWIRKYTLALVKELLGSVRGKYASMPIPNGDVSLDGDTLRSEGAAERDALISELREDLEQSSKRNLMERQNEIANFQNETMGKIPYSIYIG